MFPTQRKAIAPPAADAMSALAPAVPTKGWVARAVTTAIKTLAYYALVWPLLKLARRLWRHRDLHTIWWGCASLYLLTGAFHYADIPWWVVTVSAAAAVAGVHLLLTRHDVLPTRAETATGAAAAAGVWSVTATIAGPTHPVTAASWMLLTAALTIGWGTSPDAKHWRRVRLRVRYARRALPRVLAELGFAGVVIAARPTLSGGGRVEFPLRLPAKVTRSKLDKPAVREEIESGMHWPAGSIREIVQDPRHNDAARVLLIWAEDRIKARSIKFDPPEIPASAYDRVWLGYTEDNKPYYAEAFRPGYGGLHAAYSGRTGSTKSNLFRLTLLLRARNPHELICVIDLKSGGRPYAPLLPRIDYLVTTHEQADRFWADMATMIPLRSELLLPEHNQVLPVTEEWPAVLVLGDEMRIIWGKRRENTQIIANSTKVLSEGRFINQSVHGATQYFNQDSVHPSLLPNFSGSFVGRTRAKSEAQHLLPGVWNRLDTPHLPPGAFYARNEVSEGTLLFTPEVTDAMLAETAVETEHLAPTLEASTADRLPYYRDRWAYLPDTLLPYASERQKQMVREARERLGLDGAPRPAHPEPQAELDTADTGDTGGEDADLLSMISDRHLRSLVAAHLSPGLVSTADSNAASGGRSRGWASQRRAAWRDAGMLETPTKGKWRRIVGERDFVLGALEVEEALRAAGAGGGEAEEGQPEPWHREGGDTPDDQDIRLHLDMDLPPDLGAPLPTDRPADPPGGGGAGTPIPMHTP
ncbi:hypothetical protein [Nonomuraea dietziae]|uniref:hypothetical protein n=1 Tax=Nonomuraea dietziae TaxID=65515 RepID=UPI0033C8BC83